VFITNGNAIACRLQADFLFGAEFTSWQHNSRPKKGPFLGAIHKTDELMERVHRIRRLPRLIGTI